MTADDIERTLKWLRRLETAARMKKQKQNEIEAGKAIKLIKELTGR